MKIVWLTEKRSTLHLQNERLIFTSEGFPLQKKYSPQEQNCVQLIFLYLRCYGTMKLPLKG